MAEPRRRNPSGGIDAPGPDAESIGMVADATAHSRLAGDPPAYKAMAPNELGVVPTQSRLLPRQLREPNAIAVQRLIVVHAHCDPDQPAGECEWRIVV